jgi:SAM-dependent methyltransferase
MNDSVSNERRAQRSQLAATAHAYPPRLSMRPAATVTTAPGDVRGANRPVLRRAAFLYQDGVVLCSTLAALDELGILEPSLAADAPVTDLFPEVTPTGFGYLRVGLRSLASEGWLATPPTLDPDTTVLRWTDAGRLAARHRDRYVALGRFLASFSSTAPDAWTRAWDATRTESFLRLLPEACARWRLRPGLPPELHELLTSHLDGALVVPAMLWLRQTGNLAETGPVLPPSDDAARGMGRLFQALGWVEDDGGRWTESGRQARTFAPHYGLVGSYLPLFARLPELYRGTMAVPAPASRAREWHVHRELNIDASAAAHGRYFADADDIFRHLFDHEPVEAQPRFIADMGCGDGSWLVHLYELVSERTLRGERLASDPLLMVGLDPSKAALDRARQALETASVPALVLHGDVGDPEQVRSALAARDLSMEDGLHIRAFIDHDRAYRGGDSAAPTPGFSSGAYVDDSGHALDAAAVERDLVAHLRRWVPHVRKHGLVVLEAHCVRPDVARRHLGALHTVAFDAYHGYSHQYPVDYAAFVRCCRQAGLQPASHCERHYPSTRPFVAVSLNRFVPSDAGAPLPGFDRTAPREDTWQPPANVDLEDGRALHGLLHVDGDIRHPRTWCAAPTGFVVGEALAAVKARLDGARRGDVIRVLDYGTGTGLAAVELLKGCRERRLDEQLDRRGVALELHLVDMPSSWFAQGFALLRGCAWTRFHSLRTPDGAFRALLEVTGGRTMDAVMANMVFHLIPPRALERMTADLASVLAPGGRLLWSSPDLAPAGPHAVLFHDPNRALRRRWLELLARERAAAHPDGLERAVRHARSNLDAADSRQVGRRADSRILPEPNSAQAVADALSAHFTGTIETRTNEMLREDIVDALLVPSNQAEFLPEIADRPLREDAIRHLMLREILPAMEQRPAGTGMGLNVHWTLGSFRKPPGGSSVRHGRFESR